MKPFRKNVAIAIDGGGIRGILVTRALSMLEDNLGKPLHEVVDLAAGTSTGSIISAGIAAKLSGAQMHLPGSIDTRQPAGQRDGFVEEVARAGQAPGEAGAPAGGGRHRGSPGRLSWG